MANSTSSQVTNGIKSRSPRVGAFKREYEGGGGRIKKGRESEKRRTMFEMPVPLYHSPGEEPAAANVWPISTIGCFGELSIPVSANHRVQPSLTRGSREPGDVWCTASGIRASTTQEAAAGQSSSCIRGSVHYREWAGAFPLWLVDAPPKPYFGHLSGIGLTLLISLDWTCIMPLSSFLDPFSSSQFRSR